MAVGPYNRDPSLVTPGQITATPKRVLNRIGIRTLPIRGAKAIRGRRSR